MGCVYQMSFPNGKQYIGMTTKTLEKRFSKHLEAVNYSLTKYPVHNAIKKYGQENVVLTSLFECSDKELISLIECEFIQYRKNSGVTLYNLTEGGDGVVGASESIKRKIGDKARERFATDPSYAELTSKTIKNWLSIDGNKQIVGKRTAKWWYNSENKAKVTGDNHYKSIINKEIAAEIKIMICEGASDKEIAKKYSVNCSLVSSLAAGKSWNDVPWPNGHKPKRFNKLNPTKVSEIKALLLKKEKTQVQISVEFGISFSSISLIYRNKIWNNVPWPVEELVNA